MVERWKITRYTGGSFEENCYFVCDEQEKTGVLIDPGTEDAQLYRLLPDYAVPYILLTHGHIDHIACAKKMQVFTGARIAAMAAECALLNDPAMNLSSVFSAQGIRLVPDTVLQDGDVIRAGAMAFTVVHTPGHTAGSCCYALDELLFTGDTLMQDGVGRTDFPTGDMRALVQSLQSLCARFPRCSIFPGHGSNTSMQAQRQSNPYLAF